MDIRIALAGNPNSGKTTLFNALTGSNQFVGNWPGVTVEKKEGKLKNHEGVIITDLPGVYSLSPYTLEEVVTRDYLVGERPDAILDIVDGTNLERNLYFTTQLVEIGIPVVVAVNMMDVVRRQGDRIDFEQLSKKLGCKVLELSALKGDGIMEAAEEAILVATRGAAVPRHYFSGPVEHAIAHIEEAVVHDLPQDRQRWYAIKIFERDQKVMEQLRIPESVRTHIEEDISSAEEELDDDAESIITNERYVYIEKVMETCYVRKNTGKMSVSDRIDSVVTHRFLGLPIFALIMFFVYALSIMTVGAAATDWANDGLFGEGFYLFGIHSEDAFIPGIPVLLEQFLDRMGASQVLRGLILDGIVSGVGSVLGFVPQMLILFFMLAFLESCGYMSRIAFVLDRLFRRFGLSGKSFIPMLIATGCGVPGIMASRTIESEDDRRMTVITTTFIPCGAKIPFIALLAGALFGGSPLIATSAYFIGIASVVLSGLFLKKTSMFRGEPAPFVMELPPYHMPILKNVLRSMWDRGWSFIKKAGTVILVSSVVIWFLTYFGFTAEGFRMLAPEELDLSILAMIGGAVAWIFKPLGFGFWQPVVASMTGLVAKENIVGTLGVFYGGGNADLYEVLPHVFTKAGGYAFLCFNLLCAPCLAAIGAIRQEMNSGKWTAFAILYQCSFAYGVALFANQFGSLLEGNGNMAVCLILGAVIVFALFVIIKDRKKGPCDGNCDSCMGDCPTKEP